jgi:hypothetical protein
MISEEVRELSRVSLPVGQTSLNFDIAVDSTSKIYFSLGVRKSGSTLLHKIVSLLARRNRINLVDVPGKFFRNGFVAADWMTTEMTEIMKPGNLYLGFRSFPTSFSESPAFETSLKVFMYRDPRDALVSQYFSDAYSHAVPKNGAPGTGGELFMKKRAEALLEDVDTYVMKHAKSMGRTLLGFEGMLNDPTCLALRYEDYVFQKKRLINKILRHFEWSCHPGHIENILKQMDEVPESEDKHRFVRKVVPGDHRSKLKPETIRELDSRLREVLRVFDYY